MPDLTEEDAKLRLLGLSASPTKRSKTLLAGGKGDRVRKALDLHVTEDS